MQVGFIGLGVMGRPMVRNLLARRFPVVVHNRSRGPVDELVSGGERGAIEGALSVMVGGSEEAFTQVRDVLGAMGKTIVHVGPPGAGQTVKAANQLLVAGIIELVGEAITLLEASGVDPEPALNVIAGGLAGNRILDLKAASMLARDFTPGARVDLHHKDLGIVMDLARQHDVSLPVTALVAQLMSALRATGRGSLDHTALMLMIEELSGRSRPN